MNGRPVLGRVIHKNARHGNGEVGGRAHDAGNAVRRGALPVWPDNDVETGLGAVLQAKLTDLVGACVVHRQRPEAVTKIGHLNDHGLLFEGQITQAVHDILVRVGDEGLAGINVTGQHTDLIHGADGHNASEEAGLGDVRKRHPLVNHIDQRPSPQIGHAAHHLDVGGSHGTQRRAGNFCGSLRNRYLLRLNPYCQHRERGSDRAGN